MNTLKALILANKAAFGLFLVSLITFGGIWYLVHQHDKKIAERAVANEKLHTDSINLRPLLDTLRHISVRQDTAIQKVTRSIVKYDTLRRHVSITDTSKFVIVDTSFIHAADSVRTTCSVLQTECERYHTYADSVIHVQDTLIKHLGQVTRIKQSRTIPVLVGTLIGITAALVIRH
jgi:hypothetical protein